MGSGRFAEEGFKKAAYINSIEYIDKSNYPIKPFPQNLEATVTRPECYNLKVGSSRRWGTYIFYGGPGRCIFLYENTKILPTTPSFLFEPSSIPCGFSILGYYAQPNNHKLFGWVLTARDLSSNTLKPPVDYTLVGNTESLKIKQDRTGYFWQPVPPDGYQAVGLIVANSSQKPPLDKLRSVRNDLTEQCEADTWIWGTNGVNISNLRLTTRGTQATGVSVGTFTCQTQNSSLPPPALSLLKEHGIRLLYNAKW
ncbi:unnamed protein product [Arabidopsis halleri]